MMKSIKLTIHGHPVVLKNSKKMVLNKKTGKLFPVSNKRVTDWMKDATMQVALQTQGMDLPIFDGPVHLIVKAYGAWKEDAASIPDLSNLYQAPEDVLEDCRIFADDNQIEAHDGSRRIRMCATCDRRPILKAGPNKGKRKPDCGAVKKCPFERLEIEVREFRLIDIII
jgi:Holliday junction resolvase RusA-like endonuclease